MVNFNRENLLQKTPLSKDELHKVTCEKAYEIYLESESNGRESDPYTNWLSAETYIHGLYCDKEDFDKQKKDVLESLTAQYKIYREEIRAYLGYAAASTTLLAILLFSEWTAARGKDNADPKIYVLILISVVWYGALMSLFMTYLAVTAEYTELLEQKINDLLGYEVFLFEGKYVFPKRYSSELVIYAILAILIGVPLILLALHSFHKGLVQGFQVSSTWARILGCLGIIILVGEFVLVVLVRLSRQAENKKLMINWRS